MRISIFTPDHRGPDALLPTLESVERACDALALEYPDASVHFLIGWNGPAIQDVDLLPLLRKSKLANLQIRETWLTGMDGNVGALKKALCKGATGDYLLELDSDDELVEQALVELVKIATELDEPDFIFSDAVRVTDDKNAFLFGGRCGWETKESKVHYGLPYNPTPPMTGRNLYSILHAPDHFRCWRREFYEHIGGHDETLEVCDDFDLLQRTYLASGSMVQIKLPLYKYNIKADKSNTWLQNVDKIQAKSRELGDRRLPELLAREAALTGKKVIELGGAKGTPGRETFAWTGADTNCDLRQGIPLQSESCVAVYAQDFLEHIAPCSGVDCPHSKGQCVVGIMNEIHRVLVPGGFLIANTPSTNGDGAWGDPSHRSGWNMWSVNYYTEAVQAGFLGQEAGVPRCKFIRQRAYEWFPSEWHKLNNLKYLHMTLSALKPGAMGLSSLR